MSALAGDNRLPRYQRLADALRARIVDRSWKPGDRIPSENVIAEQFGVAPGTARQALAALVDEGLLERQHGRGTFVRRPSFDQSLFRFFRFSGAAGERLIPESRILRRSVDVMPSEVARQLGLLTANSAAGTTNTIALPWMIARAALLTCVVVRPPALTRVTVKCQPAVRS